MNIMNTTRALLVMTGKSPILFFLLIFASLTGYSQVDWIKFTTSTGFSGAAQPNDMTIDTAGNIYVIGNYTGDANFDDTTTLGLRTPIFLAKYQADGGVEWVQQIGGNSNNDGNTVAVNDSGHVYLAGVYQHSNANTILDFGNFTLAGDLEENLFLAKAGEDGTFLWAVGIIVDDLLGAHQHITPKDMLVDQNGDIYLIGSMIGSVNIEGVKYNTDPLDIDNTMLFIAKYKADGSLDWFRQTNNLTFSGFSEGHRLALANNGDVFMSAEYQGVSYDGDSLPDISTENREKCIARINPSGDMLWIHPMTSRLSDQKSFHVGIDQNDNLYTLLDIQSNLYFQDTTVQFPNDFRSSHLLVKLDGNGNRLFFKDTGYPSNLGGHNTTQVNLTTRADGTTFLTGNAFSTADDMIFGDDSLDLNTVPNPTFVGTPFIAAFNANGDATGVENHIDEFLGNSFAYDNETATMIADLGKVFMTGFLKGDFRFGNDTIMTGVFDQLFLTQLDPDFLNTSTGIERMSKQLAFRMYPNPAQNRVQLELDQWSLASGKVEIRLFDLSGKTLYENHFSSPSHQLEISGLTPGYYVVMLQDEKGIYARKLQIY